MSKSCFLVLLLLQTLVIFSTSSLRPWSLLTHPNINNNNDKASLELNLNDSVLSSLHCRGGSTSTATVTSSSSNKNKSISNARNAAIVGFKNSLASALGAVCSKTALAPFDTIKTIQQEYVSSNPLKIFEAAEVVMSRGQGFLGFYAGLGVAAVGAMPSVGLYFGIYSYSKNIIGPYLQQTLGSPSMTSDHYSELQKINRDKYLKTLTIATSAAIGNTIASVSRVPYEVLKQKLQMNQYPNTWVAISSMMRAQSPKNRLGITIKPFFPLGGISSQMARDIPYAIFTLLTYEYLRDNWVNKHSQNQSSSSSKSRSKLASGWWKDMVAGAIAGGVGSYLTNPMDVIKTRLQTSNKGGGPSGLAYLGVWDCAQKTFREEGPRAFLKGSGPRLMQKVPANAIFFVSYELFRRLLKVESFTSDNATSSENAPSEETDDSK